MSVGAARTGIYPGSFDPVTRGHLHMIDTGCMLFDRLIVTVGVNPKKAGFFAVPERIDMLAAEVAQMDTHGCKVEITAFSGLMVDFAKASGAGFILRGVRSATDFEFETQLTQVNERLNPAVRTVLIPTSAAFNAVSSSFAREVASHGGDVSWMLTPGVEARVRARLAATPK